MLVGLCQTRFCSVNYCFIMRCHKPCDMRVYLNAESTQKVTLTANYKKYTIYMQFCAEWLLLALILCHLFCAVVQLMFYVYFLFITQNMPAMVLSSPRSPVTAFSQWAPVTSWCLLIAKQKETRLHTIGTFFVLHWIVCNARSNSD